LAGGRRGNDLTDVAHPAPPVTGAAAALLLEGVSRTFGPAAGRQRAVLRDVTLEVPAGDVVAIVGRSGSGKSTLLHLAAGIDLPTTGRVVVHGHDLGALGDRERTLLRRDTIGLVFQFFHLLPHLSLRDNVALPDLIAGVPPREWRARADDLLERVGLADRASEPVQRLSGGEMQRVAVCRALLRRPRLLLADEPTGNLDDASGAVVMELLLAMAREGGTALVFVTHSREIAALARLSRRLHDGVLEPV
jgi:ABC-type lipoprotein export system ATPase subunit